MDKSKIDPALKLMFRKLLGEVYSLRKALELSTVVEDATIFGLKHGFEEAIDECLPDRFIATEKLQSLTDVLEAIERDPEKKSAFRGFYDIEEQLKQIGVDRSLAAWLLIYLNARGEFTDLIEKMNSVHSPVEMKTFRLPKDL